MNEAVTDDLVVDSVSAHGFLDFVLNAQSDESQGLYAAIDLDTLDKGRTRFPKIDRESSDVLDLSPYSENDLYFCPAPFESESKKRENVAGSWCVWIDIDQPTSLSELQLKSLPYLPSAVVETSPGHYHCLWRLDRFLSVEETQRLNLALVRAFGADDSGWDAGQVLRLPAGKNTKPERGGFRPRLVDFDPECVYSAEWLSEWLPEPLDDRWRLGTKPRVAEELLAGVADSHELSEIRAGLTEKQLGWLSETQQGKRSNASWAFVMEMLDRGVQPDIIIALIADSPLGRDKFGTSKERIIAEVERAMTKHQPPAEPPAFKGPSVPEQARRRVSLTPASQITIRAVRWLWKDRIPSGCLTLLAGREGIGKSTVAYQLVADLTRGKLLGAAEGEPRNVIVAATEDSWGHTIVPRLMAAGADLDRVFRVDVTTSTGTEGTLTLPSDLGDLEWAITEISAALILLDPLMSRLGADLDSHKDAEVRQALEPLVALADKCDAAFLGLIHLNKSTGGDPLSRMMGSRAFAAVARAVLFVMTDPDDESVRLLGQPKNNLGRTDLPTLTFTIRSAHVADTEDGEPITTGQIDWQGSTGRSIAEALAEADGGRKVTAVGEASKWLVRYLKSAGGTEKSATVKEAGMEAGYSVDSLKRARIRTKIQSETIPGIMPRQTLWSLPDGSAGDFRETAPIAPTAPTGA